LTRYSSQASLKGLTETIPSNRNSNPSTRGSIEPCIKEQKNCGSKAPKDELSIEIADLNLPPPYISPEKPKPTDKAEKHFSTQKKQRRVCCYMILIPIILIFGIALVFLAFFPRKSVFNTVVVEDILTNQTLHPTTPNSSNETHLIPRTSENITHKNSSINSAEEKLNSNLTEKNSSAHLIEKNSTNMTGKNSSTNLTEKNSIKELNNSELNTTDKHSPIPTSNQTKSNNTNNTTIKPNDTTDNKSSQNKTINVTNAPKTTASSPSTNPDQSNQNVPWYKRAFRSVKHFFGLD
jgi:hypothetical protein